MAWRVKAWEPLAAGGPRGSHGSRMGATGVTGAFRLDRVMSRLDRYIDLMDSPKENSMVNSQYDSLPISHSILHRV